MVIVYIAPVTDATTMPAFESFDWSGGNDRKNWDRHRVTPLEVEQVFFNTPLIIGADEAHSQQEKRCYALGQTDARRELFIVFTLRGKQVRVVSARDMSRKERKVYRP